MHQRYLDPEIEDQFSHLSTLRWWHRVEMQAIKAQEGLGLLPPGTHDRINDQVEVEPMICMLQQLREKQIHHDVAAFVDVIQSLIHGSVTRCGDTVEMPLSNCYHWGLTSSDIVDSALMMQIRSAARYVNHQLSKMRTPLDGDGEMQGITHGVAADPVPLHHWLNSRVLPKLDVKCYIQLSGPCGNYPIVPKEVEDAVAAAMDAATVITTQVLPRMLLLDVFHQGVRLAMAAEKLSIDLRLAVRDGRVALKRTNPDEKGSSSMPHKINPVLLEQNSGLARMVRSYYQAVAETVMWDERDMSNSVLERNFVPDLFHALSAMLRNLEAYQLALVPHPAFGTHTTLHDEMRKGLKRDDAYRSIQSQRRHF